MGQLSIMSLPSRCQPTTCQRQWQARLHQLQSSTRMLYPARIPSRMLWMREPFPRSSRMPFCATAFKLAHVQLSTQTRGAIHFYLLAFFIRFHHFLILFVTVLLQEFLVFGLRLPLLILLHFSSIPKNSKILLNSSTNVADTLALSLEFKLNRFSVRSKLLPSLLFQNQIQKNFDSFKTSHFRTVLLVMFLPLTVSSILMIFRALGVLSTLQLFLFLAFPLALKERFVTSLRPIDVSHLPLTNGRGWWYAWRMTNSQSTCQHLLVAHQLEVSGDLQRMVYVLLFVLPESVLLLNGWMIISSFVFLLRLSFFIIIAFALGPIVSGAMGAAFKNGHEYGIPQVFSKTVVSMNLITTVRTKFWTCREPHQGRQRTHVTPTASMILIPSRNLSVSLGRRRRRFHSRPCQSILDSSGISTDVWWEFLTRRKQSTYRTLMIGTRLRRIHYPMLRNCTENSCTLPISFQQDDLTSRVSKPSCPHSVTVHTCHVDLQNPFMQTSHGGERNFRVSTFPGQSPAPSASPTSKRTPMQALESVWVSQLATPGAHGDSSRVGNRTAERSRGQKLLPLNCSRDASSETLFQILTSASTATTQESSTHGSISEAMTSKSTLFSKGSMMCATTLVAQSTLRTSQASVTQQTVPREGDIRADLFSPSVQSLTPSPVSLPSSKTVKSHMSETQILQNPFQMHCQNLCDIRSTASKMSGFIISEKGSMNTRSSLTTIQCKAPPHPRPYRDDLCLQDSLLRPHCLARDRLRLWHPPQSRSLIDRTGHILPLPSNVLDQLHRLLTHAWSESTQATFGSGLLAFHAFCDKHEIPEHMRAPCSSDLLSAFVASLAGSYSHSTISNYVAGVRAWHIIHRVEWDVHDAHLKQLLSGAQRLAPPSSTREQRQPFLLSHLLRIRDQCDFSKPVHAAVFACLVTTFYTCSRLGEFTLKSLSSFDPEYHVKRSDMRSEKDRFNNCVTVFHLPKTKTSKKGEDVTMAAQADATDPVEAVATHFRVNDPPLDGPLFAYRHGDSHRPLTKSVFLSTIKTLFSKAHIETPLHGHSLRTGGTLEYLLRGVSFEVVKVIGRQNLPFMTLCYI
ncbi:hypothetical protein SCHPADRAFT_758613 [Schizopora paradoxa]|uniref:Tyr recombinase domain-containing protein n=1 Tax=Schizopora paradoxa TaxID=27342 RepID=A0A0H2QZ54_9AGAM|nr:hypothetical protein SCHPADRAFT_758613 [Schizopora paradoxa]